MGLTLAMTLIFEFSRSYVILTIWWPRSGVRIYQIVTRVTSDVGVPSTHLVFTEDRELKIVTKWVRETMKLDNQWEIIDGRRISILFSCIYRISKTATHFQFIILLPCNKTSCCMKRLFLVPCFMLLLASTDFLCLYLYNVSLLDIIRLLDVLVQNVPFPCQ